MFKAITLQKNVKKIILKIKEFSADNVNGKVRFKGGIMFESSKYKKIAKQQLKGRWLIPIMAYFIMIIISFILNRKITAGYSTWFSGFVKSILSGTTSDFINTVQPPVNAGKSSFLFTCIQFFINSIVAFAFNYVFVVYSHTVEKQSFKTYFKGYSYWLQAFLGSLWNYLWVFLWTLLLIIPGIIKSISYSMIFNILAEYPDIGVRKAMNLSKEMTKGQKANLFMMGLSFIGWYLLTLITFGIAGLYVMPYIRMSYINAYHDIKQNAIERGILKEEDFISSEEE